MLNSANGVAKVNNGQKIMFIGGIATKIFFRSLLAITIQEITVLSCRIENLYSNPVDYRIYTIQKYTLEGINIFLLLALQSCNREIVLFKQTI